MKLAGKQISLLADLTSSGRQIIDQTKILNNPEGYPGKSQ